MDLAIVLKKKNESYVVVYDERKINLAVQTLGRWAANPDLNLTWYDAAVMSQRVRQGENPWEELAT